MSKLNYVGLPPTTPDGLVIQSKAEELAAQVQTVEEMRQEVGQELSRLASTDYVDSVKGTYATETEVASVFNSKPKDTDLGKTVAPLNSNGKVPTAYLPSRNTRGARYFHWEGESDKPWSFDGNGSVRLASMSVSNPSGPYAILAWAQVEAQVVPDTGPQTAGAVIEVGLNGTRLSYGTAGPGYQGNFDMIDVVPVSFSMGYTGTTTLTLSGIRAGSGNGSIQYTGYGTVFSAITIPVTT